MSETAKKFWLFILTLLVLATSYRLVGELTLEQSKQTILITRLDETIPFLPELTVIYSSLYCMWLPLVFARNISYGYLKGVVWATFTVFGLFYIFYFLIPASYPRPIQGDCNCWRHAPIWWLYSIDLPNNTFPSSHAAGIAILFAATKNKLTGIGRYAYIAWGILILISTVAIKQHYVLDTITGFVAGYAVWLLFKKRTVNS